MRSVDSVVAMESAAEAENELAVFESQLKKSAEHTAAVIKDYLNADLDAVAKVTRCSKNIEDCMKSDLRMLPVVRSVYGLLLPSWMVSNNKWE